MPLFHRDSVSSSSSDRSIDDPHQPRHGHSFFGRKSSGSSISSGSSSTRNSRHRSILHRSPLDPSIKAAQERVVLAETAEKEADKALMASKKAVKDARDHVKHLEREAAEEARLAKIKQSHAKSISKRAKPLGRKIYLPVEI
ncbi:hypothetical protein N7462_009786 [Penicillium macrosclerotiorum]|uniref:uncharacterized protein n=1 Tax=Penicillium macrosclerotiorum TaxID=303699 RepID=UPI0025479F39|nr:uncharacterized protein N7462_009786 [Penicillium macrosclerotiorum]KAJ5668716.1 hypothetical protein N7462_009786 [Penicillium macrosclerotiorum]